MAALKRPDPHPAFAQVDHRPWPLPSGPWAWRQEWLDLAFLHFEADAQELRRLLPAGVELELFEGKAWIGIVPFSMRGVTKRGWPAPSMVSDFPEINVRTYVSDGKKSGVWFLSLDAASHLAVQFARRFFHLPYFYAQIQAAGRRDTYSYSAKRGAHGFVAEYEAFEAAPSRPGTFAHWATERYCLYSADVAGRCFRAEIQHVKWPLQRAQVSIVTNTLADVRLGAMHPAVLFSSRLDVVVWPLERIG